MAKYRKKPVVIEAIQLTESNFEEVCEFMGRVPVRYFNPIRDTFGDANAPVYLGLYIETLEGKMLASLGDMIVKGIDGEFYPCKPEIFAKTYEHDED